MPRPQNSEIELCLQRLSSLASLPIDAPGASLDGVLKPAIELEHQLRYLFANDPSHERLADAHVGLVDVFDAPDTIHATHARIVQDNRDLSGRYAEWIAQAYISPAEKLFAAIAACDRDADSNILSEIDLNCRDCVGRTPLHLAILSGAPTLPVILCMRLDPVEVVRTILERSASNEEASKGTTNQETLHKASSRESSLRSSQDDWPSEDDEATTEKKTEGAAETLARLVQKGTLHAYSLLSKQLFAFADKQDAQHATHRGESADRTPELRGKTAYKDPSHMLRTARAGVARHGPVPRQLVRRAEVQAFHRGKLGRKTRWSVRAGASGQPGFPKDARSGREVTADA
ncbi:hypothetical protein B0H12DRAFT_1236726 [Mycena haematopus]|nr:hypothetical protein B0H12DRAFT_1236726 [Mycena haematopus]